MTIPYHIIIGNPLTKKERSSVQEIIHDTFHEIDQIYNKWNSGSELSLINQAQAFKEIPLSPKLYQFLLLVDEMVALSSGKFDPTIEPVQQLWKRSLEEGSVPAHSEIEQKLLCVGWEKFHYTSDQLWKEHADCSLDLGGIAKGFAIDLIVQRLWDAGYENTYVEWGGEISTRGEHPDHRPWRVLVTKLGVPGDTQTIVELRDNAIATSGDYLQNWLVEGKTYSHIFNPHSGVPLEVTEESICSVTIVAPSCMLADTIATTAMLFATKEDAETWLQKLQKIYPELQFWVFTRQPAEY